MSALYKVESHRAVISSCSTKVYAKHVRNSYNRAFRPMMTMNGLASAGSFAAPAYAGGASRLRFRENSGAIRF